MNCQNSSVSPPSRTASHAGRKLQEVESKLSRKGQEREDKEKIPTEVGESIPESQKGSFHILKNIIDKFF
jgi:hypothetical protein